MGLLDKVPFPRSQRAFFEKLFDATDGHDHDGTNSKLAAAIADGTVTAGKIADGAVTMNKLAAGTGFAALMTAGAGVSKDYDGSSETTDTLAEADAAVRVVIMVITVTEVFAANTGTQPIFTFGQADATTKFADGALLTDAAEDTVFVLAGELTGTQALVVDCTTGQAGSGTGEINVTAILLPKNSA